MKKTTDSQQDEPDDFGVCVWRSNANGKPTKSAFDLRGMTEADALASIPATYTSRIIRRDGVSMMCTRDYRPIRVNLTIEKGIVTDAHLG